MTDQLPTFGATPGFEQTQGNLEGETVAQEQSQFVTMDALRAALDEQYRRIDSRVTSLTFKQENHLKEMIEKKIDTLEKSYRDLGLQVPDAARQRVIDETILSQLEQGAEEAQPAAAPSPELVAYVNRRAQKIAEKAGVLLTPADPEFALVNQATPDPDEYLESWEKAVASKANRLKGAQVQQQAPAQTETNAMPPTNPAARVPMAGSGAPSGSSNYDKYLAEVGRAPASSAIDIRRKWRPILKKEGIEL